MSPTAPRRIQRSLLPQGMLLLTLLVGMPLAIVLGSLPQEGAASPAVGAANARPVILHAHAVAFAGTLAGGLHLGGTLYPGFPGRNTLHLSGPGAGALPSGSRIDLVATMPGMAMSPAHAALVARRGGADGALALPMFGIYQLRVVVQAPPHRWTGILCLELPLPPLAGT